MKLTSGYTPAPLISAENLTPKECEERAIASKKARPSAEQRAEFQALAQHWRQKRARQ